MKAIETIYKGYKFRSRLEARWAVYFDFLNIHWLYEDEGFVLSDGTCYLPDFYLPHYNGGLFVEVKGEFTSEEKDKCCTLCIESGKPILLAEGVPDFRAYLLLENNAEGVCWSTATPYFINSEPTTILEIDPSIADFFTYEIPEYLMDNENKLAIHAAKQARFEHKN